MSVKQSFAIGLALGLVVAVAVAVGITMALGSQVETREQRAYEEGLQTGRLQAQNEVQGISAMLDRGLVEDNARLTNRIEEARKALIEAEDSAAGNAEALRILGGE